MSNAYLNMYKQAWHDIVSHKFVLDRTKADMWLYCPDCEKTITIKNFWARKDVMKEEIKKIVEDIT